MSSSSRQSGNGEATNEKLLYTMDENALHFVAKILSPTSGQPPPHLPVVEPPSMPSNPDWLWLSPLERQIVEFLLVNGPSVAKQISKGIGQGNEPSSRLREILPNLIDRCILERSHEGYYVRWPADAPRELPSDPRDCPADTNP